MFVIGLKLPHATRTIFFLIWLAIEDAGSLNISSNIVYLHYTFINATSDTNFHLV